MRKKELLAMPELLATEEMMQVVKEDKPEMVRAGYCREEECYHYYIFLRVAEAGGMLKVSIFTRKSLLNNVEWPLFDIYLNKKEKKWLVNDRKKGTWRTADIYNLLWKDMGYHERNTCTWCQEPNVIQRYLGTKETDERRAIRKVQECWRKERLEEKDRKTLEAWDAQMAKIPPIPEDFEDWVLNTAFLKHQYIFYQAGKHRKEKECFCTTCRSWYTADSRSVKHNTTGTCPVCRNMARYKGYNKQKVLIDELPVGLLQKASDGYVLRYFDCRIKRRWTDYWEPDLTVHEKKRKMLGMDMRAVNAYAMENYKQRGTMRWCMEPQRGYFYQPQCVVYMNNLEETLGERARNTDLWVILKGDTGTVVEAEKLLRNVLKYSCIEYLQKAGLETIEWELLNAEKTEEIYDIAADTLSGFLRIDKQRVLRIREVDGNMWAVKALQREERIGDKVSKDHLSYINQESIDVDRLHMKETGMSLARTLNYLRKQSEINNIGFQETLQYYDDYLDMARQRGMDISDEIVCHQREMKKYHDYYVREREKEKGKKRDREVDKKFRNIAAEFEKNRQHFEFKNKKYVILVPKCASDITLEGRLQHHCVGVNDTYLKKMEEGKSYILFLRHSEEPETPYYTLEVTWDGKILQEYGAYDRKPNWDEVKGVLKKYTKEIQKRVQKESIKIAG